MHISPLPDFTPYPDINAVLGDLSRGITRIFGDNLVGIYLFGSLSYGDFNPASSDIDVVTIVKNPASAEELASIQGLHQGIAAAHEKWAGRLECSYTPLTMLASILPPDEPRPYYGEGTFYPEAHYGNEWIINLYLLYQHGIELVGPDFNTLIPPPDITEVQKACIRDLFQEWQPKLDDPAWLDNSHYQSYLVLNLCRILYTVTRQSTGSKKASAAWVKAQYPQWSTLIQTAESWGYGVEMTLRNETLEFLRFVIAQVGKTPLYPA